MKCVVYGSQGSIVGRTKRTIVTSEMRLLAYDRLTEGRNRKEIALEVGVSLQSIHAWAQRWKKKGRSQVLDEIYNRTKTETASVAQLIPTGKTTSGVVDNITLEHHAMVQDTLFQLGQIQHAIVKGLAQATVAKVNRGDLEIELKPESLFTLKVIAETTAKMAGTFPLIERLGRSSKKDRARINKHLEELRALGVDELIERRDKRRRMRELHGPGEH